jgi:Fibronectin type III domain/Matrixin
MTPHDVFKRRALLVGAGFAAVLVLVYVGDRGTHAQYSKSNAATYSAVLAEIQQATTTQAVLAFAQTAGLTVTSSSQPDPDDNLDTDTEILITAPNSTNVLAAVTEYNDVFPLPPVAPSSTSTPPAIPTNLQSTGSTASTISLQWTEPTGKVPATYYGIYRDGIEVGTTTQTSYTDKGLTHFALAGDGVLYTYYIVAYSPTGASSESVPVIALNAAAPNQVTGLSASVSGDTVTLSWSPTSAPSVSVSGDNLVIAEKVYRSTSPNCTATSSLFDALGGAEYSNAYATMTKSGDNLGNPTGWHQLSNPNEYIEANLPPGTYYYCVAAVDSDETGYNPAGSSGFTLLWNQQGPVSVPVTAVVSSYVDNTPPIPINFTETSAGANSVTLGWAPSTYATQSGDTYRVFGLYYKWGGIGIIGTSAGTSYTDNLQWNEQMVPTGPQSWAWGYAPADENYSLNTIAPNGKQSRTVGGGSVGDGNYLDVVPGAEPPAAPADVYLTTSGDSVDVAITPPRDGPLVGQGGSTPGVNPLESMNIYRTTTAGCTASVANLVVANFPIDSAPDYYYGRVAQTPVSYDDINMPLGTYYYCVAIVDPFGDIGAASAPAKVTVTGSTSGYPAAPTNVAITTVAKSGITLSWTASANPIVTVPASSYPIMGYQVYRNGVQIASTTNPTFTDTNVTQGQSYVYNVTTYLQYQNRGAAGELPNYISSSSEEASAEIPPPTPSAPTGLTITTTTTSSVSLKWSPSTETGGTIAGYKIYLQGNQVGTSTATSFTVTGLTGPSTGGVVAVSANAVTGGGAAASAVATAIGRLPFTVYSFSVAAYDTAGTVSAQSASVSATIALQVAINTSTRITAFSASSTSIALGSAFTLTWSSQNASSCAASGSWTGSQAVSGTSKQTPTSTGAKIYTLTCKGPANSTSSSVTETVTAAPSAAISTPSNLAFVTSTSTSSKSLAFKWSASTESGGTIAGYRIYRNGTQIGTSTTPSFTDATIVTNTSYVYAVAAYDTKGNVSAMSASITARVSAPIPYTSPVVAPKTGASLLDDLFDPDVACAQTTSEGSTVVGNNTGLTAECGVAGSDKTAMTMVYANGQTYGVSGDYDFSVADKDMQDTTPEYNATFNTAAADAVADMDNIGASQGSSESGGTNQIILQIDNNSSDNGDNVIDQSDGTSVVNDGNSFSVSTLQSNGTYDNTCTAQLFILNSQNVLGMYTATYFTNLAMHEMGHCLGLAHSDDPANIMYGGGLQNTVAANTLLTFDPAQIQYLKDRAAGNTIQVDPSTCNAVCAAGEGYVPSNASGVCVSQQSLCGNQPNSIWNDQAQKCLSCPDGTNANLSESACIPTGENGCTVVSVDYDPVTGLCVDPTQQTCTTNNEGVVSCTYPNNDECTCGTGGHVTCFNSNGSDIATPAGACQGTCSDGEIQTADGSCIVNCDLHPDDPSCAGAPADDNGDYCTQNPSDPECQNNNDCVLDPNSQSCLADVCNADPTAAGCPDSCELNPDNPNCPDYCDQNPSDPSCDGSDSDAVKESTAIRVSKLTATGTVPTAQ